MLSYIRDKSNQITSKFNHFYFIPLFGLICWYTLLFALVGLWVSKGSPSYPDFGEPETPIPLERVGVIMLPGFFITFIVIHSICFCSSMYLEFYHRKIGKLIKFIKPTLQKRLAYASITIGIFAQLFFIAQAIVNTVYLHRRERAASHYAVLLAIFGILVMISLALNFTNYYIMGQYYRQYVNGERWNKFTISFVVKICWLFVTLLLAVTTAVIYIKGNHRVSSFLEWAFHFWYGLLLAFWTYDLYPLTELRALRNPARRSSSQDGILSKIGLKKKKESPTSIVNIHSSGSSDSQIFTYEHKFPEV